MSHPRPEAAKYRATLDERLAIVTNFDLESFREQNASMGADLDKAVEVLSEALRMCAAIRTLDLDHASLGALDLLGRQVVRISDVLTRITPSAQQDAASRAVSIRSEVGQIKPLLSWLFLAVETTRMAQGLVERDDETIRKFEERTAEVTREAETAAAACKQSQTQASEILTNMRAASATAGTLAQAKHFGRQADAHKEAGDHWLAVIGLLLVLATILTLAFFATGFPDPKPGRSVALSLIGHLSFRLVFLSLVFYALVWAARNHKTHRHNEVINRQRELALNTFMTFAEATDDADVKKAVLLQAVQSIFAAHPSGYLPEGPDPRPDTTLTELVEKLSKKAG